jgi:hypothetical protein
LNEKDRARRVVRIRRIASVGPRHGYSSFGTSLNAPSQ